MNTQNPRNIQETGAIAATPAMGDLQSRLRRLVQLRRNGPLSRLASETRMLKMVARGWRYDLVADIAHLLETDIATMGRATIIDAYLDCMADAIRLKSADGNTADSLLASVRVRMVA